ncbi:hypothetical protein F2P81_022069 [Scophthalmus maximus]|uniref:Uncharacterized protein n=1 Tax=Scophthalmus maximus TaxID=52904 RepID=A0A6A4RZ46_SCOMX|nr:hypothetical protein F2P81_022069 [Scophthalmus maximus]
MDGAASVMCVSLYAAYSTTGTDVVITRLSFSFGHDVLRLFLAFTEGLGYLAALSMLRSSEDQAPVPQNKSMVDIEEQAASYERKLIEVPGDLSQTSDDHSLSDFETDNDNDNGDADDDNDAGSEDGLLFVSLRAHRALINVWIPSVFLQGRSANAYHVYQTANTKSTSLYVLGNQPLSDTQYFEQLIDLNS